MEITHKHEANERFRVCFDALGSSQQLFSHAGTISSLPGLKHH